MTAILEGYAAARGSASAMDADGLLAAGEPGQQLTWMDARVGDREITPRIGKPVEVQALWLNALAVAGAVRCAMGAALCHGPRAFEERFWNADAMLPLRRRRRRTTSRAASTRTFRPNQILAVGGLPLAARRRRPRANAVVDAVERELLTPLGLRSLAPAGAGVYGPLQGGPDARDARPTRASVWPWLLGPFVDAWLRTGRATAAGRAEPSVGSCGRFAPTSRWPGLATSRGSPTARATHTSWLSVPGLVAWGVRADRSRCLRPEGAKRATPDPRFSRRVHHAGSRVGASTGVNSLSFDRCSRASPCARRTRACSARPTRSRRSGTSAA